MSSKKIDPIRLDLNNPVFQRQLFNLPKRDQGVVLGSFRKLSNMTWQQLYADRGLKWEVVYSRVGPKGAKLYTFRIGKGFRGLAFRDESWLRVLSLHPDHDTAYD